MKAINEVLQMQPDQYENMRFGVWARWCESVTTNEQEWQMVLANSKINRWFEIEYAKCETEFVRLINRYEGSASVKVDDVRRCYNETTFRMFSISPKPLLDEVKHREPTPLLSIHGMQVPTPHFILN
jgi:hypothetical protein